MTEFLGMAGGVVLAGIGLFFIIMSLRNISTNDMSLRIEEYVIIGDTSSQGGDIAVGEGPRLTGSLYTRIFAPGIKNVGNFFLQFTPVEVLSSVNRKLEISANPYGMRAREFIGLNVVVWVMGIWVVIAFPFNFSPAMNIIMRILMSLSFGFGPTAWLNGKMRVRQDSVLKGLPDALDMLSVCASAGLGFDQALQRISDLWLTPVGIEFGRVISEMEVGVSRGDALRNLANRVDVSELSSFISVILQSEQLGMSISDTLHSQAEQMRMQRRFRAQEQAQKMPAKMLFPLAFLILPALMAVLLGPAISQVANLF